jgi:hypothetical protein
MTINFSVLMVNRNLCILPPIERKIAVLLFFDMDFKRINEIEFYIHPSSAEKFEKPKSFEVMKSLAAELSKGMPFVRMDFYEIGGKPYFGEFTFFTGGGFYLFKPDAYEEYLGELIDIANLQ